MYPGPTEESLSCLPIGSLSCTLPWWRCDRQYNKQQMKQTKQNNIKISNKNKTEIKQREPTKLNKQARHPHDRAAVRKNKYERKECQQNQKTKELENYIQKQPQQFAVRVAYRQVSTINSRPGTLLPYLPRIIPGTRYVVYIMLAPGVWLHPRPSSWGPRDTLSLSLIHI